MKQDLWQTDSAEGLFAGYEVNYEKAVKKNVACKNNCARFCSRDIYRLGSADAAVQRAKRRRLKIHRRALHFGERRLRDGTRDRRYRGHVHRVWSVRCCGTDTDRRTRSRVNGRGRHSGCRKEDKSERSACFARCDESRLRQGNSKIYKKRVFDYGGI